MRRPTVAGSRAFGVLVGLMAIASGFTGCASEPKTPAEVREERVTARITDTFSRSQATCIMKVLDDPTIKALDRSAALPSDSEALRIYSNAVVACTATG